jgi:peptidoglycan/LPS O-acetylase OafA/YrhL
VALVAPAAFGAAAGGWPRRVMAWRWLAAAGLVSYGVYLWQGAWVEQAATWASSWGFAAGHRLFPVELVVVAAGSVACAAISYRLVERPLMRFKYRRHSSPPRDPAAVASPVADG